MRSRHTIVGGRAAASVLGLLWLSTLALSLAHGAEETPAVEPTPERAVELYDAGKYAEARVVLEQLDADGAADGKLLYRLFYCQRMAGDGKSVATLRRAVEKLEAESSTARDLESTFYLVNGYSSLNRPADAQTAARAATTRIENGELDQPETGLEQFRLGKLYADQRQAEKAERWYRQAVESFTEEGQAMHVAYLKWAARYLADVTFQREDWSDAEQYLARLAELEEPTKADLDRLAVSRARIGLYREAGKSWRAAELMDPANANRARYCYRLAEAAAKLEGLSATAPDGRLWPELDKAELETIMKEQAEEARTIKQEAQDLSWTDKEERAALQSRLKRARPIFVAAALEYALQGNSIREAAFFGGYAPLVIKDSEWKLPRPASSQAR
jgi:tetratricopeptide (TPR) repeat protein